MSDQQKIDLSRISDEALPELFRQAQIVLDGTIQLALAADTRAMTLAGIFGGGSIALLAIAATVQASATGQIPAVVSPVCFVASALFVASGICAWAAQPADFQISGYEPRLLMTVANEEGLMQRGITVELQRRIDQNRKSLERSACLTNIGIRIAFLCVPLGALIYLFSARS